MKSVKTWIVVGLWAVAASAWAGRAYRGGAVASAHPVASAAAVEMLDKGGNAVDAAVAAAFALAVVDPHHSGLGGGGFALVHDVTKAQDRVLDFREVAPAAATRDMYLRDGKPVPELSTDGPLSVAVPGAVAGYLELLAAHGKLKPAVVLAPAIKAARQGFWVADNYVSRAESRRDCLRQYPEAARIFLTAGDQEAPAAGTVLKQPELAKTLEKLAAQGAKAFYAGPVAAAIVSTVKEGGGILTAQDLTAYKPRWREPLEGSYRGHRVLSIPPPSAGGLVVLQVLGGLEQTLPKGFPYRDPGALHTLIEMARRAYVDRTKFLGDPGFTEIPLARLVSPEHVKELAQSIDPARATASLELLPQPGAPKPAGAKGDAGTLGPEKKQTAHVSVIDRAGNAVALTTTINYFFGSCMVAKGTGVLLNDEMDDFTAQPGTPNVYGLVSSEANAVAPGKAPLSSMAGTLVFQQGKPAEVMLAVGSPGGSTIPTTVVQVISNVIDAGMDVTRAVGTGRIHHQYLPDRVMVEKYGLEPATLQALTAKGHRFAPVEAWGDAEAVMVDPVTKLRSAAADPRNDGAGLGQD